MLLRIADTAVVNPSVLVRKYSTPAPATAPKPRPYRTAPDRIEPGPKPPKSWLVSDWDTCSNPTRRSANGRRRSFQPRGRRRVPTSAVSVIAGPPRYDAVTSAVHDR